MGKIFCYFRFFLTGPVAESRKTILSEAKLIVT
jgi:hypothetical protein